ncbi:hypothetical protein CC80DRAFT_287997 [Byssothecium circinans]|uniref:Uncharacterized protein n=1 Tax=Byssothecium circinans TaxID=147558 RepID=A0A6A5U896_9PLEO|nr:hypothetical protein CC80DRAFT_287997 [Byssothecium circinans]
MSDTCKNYMPFPSASLCARKRACHRRRIPHSSPHRAFHRHPLLKPHNPNPVPPQDQKVMTTKQSASCHSTTLLNNFPFRPLSIHHKHHNPTPPHLLYSDSVIPFIPSIPSQPGPLGSCTNIRDNTSPTSATNTAPNPSRELPFP